MLDLAEKLKSLRKEKNVSQEKLAEYLSVSFQAVSKWETGNTYPDISLLPDIARFFGITIDELLQVEKLNEKELYREYEKKQDELYRSGKRSEMLPLWLEAYQKMPNNVEVKEILMSTYFDTDRIKYQKEIVELGTQIYASDASMYYKGQAVHIVARTYAENGNYEMAKKWIDKTVQILHTQEILYAKIDSGEALIGNIRYCVYWLFHNLFHMAMRIYGDESLAGDLRYKQDVCKSVTELYEALYKNDDMDFESLMRLYQLHETVAQLEISLDNQEQVIRAHLNRALECVIRSMSVEAHELSHPLLRGWQVWAPPDDRLQWVRLMKAQIADHEFDPCRNAEWFAAVENRLNDLLAAK